MLYHKGVGELNKNLSNLLILYVNDQSYLLGFSGEICHTLKYNIGYTFVIKEIGIKVLLSMSV